MIHGSYEMRKDYFSFMETCRKECPEFFDKYHFSIQERRNEYILLYIYNKYKANGYKPVVITKAELLEHYYKDVNIHSIHANLATLEKKGLITRTTVYNDLGQTIGNEYVVKGFEQSID